MASDCLDLFAGAGGWDMGARTLGLDPLGIEIDDAACATRASSGLRTVQSDVASLDPTAFSPCDVLIASPPCPTFSTAGDQRGSLLLDLLVSCASRLARGVDDRAHAVEAAYEALLPSAKAADRARRDAHLSLLVVEPLRWALALRPRILAWEQVPPVLPLWRMFAPLLEAVGYKTWYGVLNAADYGVPQTRRRAFLLASRAGRALPPSPTHCRGGAESLGGALAPWVSMADALGWGMTARPSVPLMARRGDGGVNPLDGGSGPRAAIQSERENGRWRQRSGQSVNEPSVVIHGRANLNAWVPEALEERQAHGVRREPHEPAPTITSSHDNGNLRWILATNRGQDENGSRQEVDGGRPAPTVSGKAGGQWVFERPSTSVCGDASISAPGYRGRPDEYTPDGEYTGERSMEHAVRITLEEAAILQGFPPDYPWQGTRTKQFEQVGNAVPPPLAAAILGALLDAAF